ncbi:MAG: FAD-binding oxidoreductase [Planctomycetota bacterium]
MSSGRELAGTFQTPGNLAVMRELVTAASQHGTGIVATGSPLPPPEVPGDSHRVIISLSALEPPFDHQVSDLIVTAGAGQSVDTLQDRLRMGGQRLAAEIPRGLGVTLGGAVAAGLDGFNAGLFGPLRDQVLGISYLDSLGRHAHCGGKVVKNVTGYDLSRLHVGAHGRFGLMYEITLKLRPLPDHEVTVVLARPTLSLALKTGLALRSLGTKISGLVVATGAVVAGSTVLGTDDSDHGPKEKFLLLRMEGHPQTLQRTCEALAKRDANLEVLDTPSSDRLWSGLGHWPWQEGFRVDFQLRPSQLEQAMAALSGTKLDTKHSMIADIARGRLQLSEPSRVRGEGADQRLIELGIPDLLHHFGATASLPNDPEDRPRRRDRFGQLPVAHRALQNRLAEALDPSGIFAAGRRFEEAGA